MILLMMLIISTKNIKANELNEKSFEIEYEGKKGFFVPPDMFLLFDKLLTNYPILEQENDELRDWIIKKNALFKESIDEYFKLKKIMVISIGFSIGSGFVVVGMVIGLVFYAVLSYCGYYRKV